MSDTNTGQMEKEGFATFFRDLWTLTKPYFTSEEKWSAWGLVALVLVLTLLLVQINVELSYWRNDFYTALQHKDWKTFWNLITTWQPVPKGHHGAIFGVMPGFTPMVCIFIPVAVYATYVTQWLQIRWRRWMTEVWLDRWLSDRTQYHLSVMPVGPKGPDNPDQRIAEDLRDGVNFTISLVLDFIKNAVSLVQFIFILGMISGPLVVFGIYVPAYLLWVAMIYAIIGTYITHKVGNPLAFLRNYQQTCEANFRFGLARVREYAEAIALYLGERDEKEDLLSRFNTLIVNWEQIMLRTKKLGALTSSYSQAAVIFPYLVAAPRYFFGPLELGDLMQIASSFNEVQTALSWFVSSYTDLASWRATVSRLANFARAMEAADKMERDAIVVEDRSGDAVTVSHLNLQLPNGTVLLADESFEIPAGVSVVIVGASGSGKSTLFRAIAGIWPFARGLIQRSVKDSMFLPQRPYIPLGTLRRVVTYPGIRTYDDAQIKQALLDVGLPNLVDNLDKVDHWPTALSGGEQQRVAVARALLQRPRRLFLDEATASLDPEGEAKIYRTIREQLTETSIVSIAHRESVKKFHDEQLELKRGADGEPGKLVRTVL